MARKSDDDYTYDIMMNEVRLALDPENIVASLLLRAATLRLPQTEIADVLGVSIATYRAWELDAPVVVGTVRDRVIALLDWLTLVASTHTDIRGQLSARAALGDPPAEGDNARSTSGEQQHGHV